MPQRTPWFPLLMTLALAGCPTGTIPAEDSGDTGVEDVCPDYAPSPLAACLAWDGAAPDGFAEDAFAVTISGTVEAVGAGAPEVDCGYADDLAGHAPLGNVDGLSDPSASWVRVVDAAGERWTLAWLLPGVATPAVGAAVTLDAEWRRGFSDIRGEVRLTADDGALVGWLASESLLTSMTLPTGLMATLGEPVCVETGTCSELTISRVDVAEGSSTATLAPGDTADLASFKVTLGESEAYLDTGACEDGPAHILELAAVPR